jgi:hypothetical protein
VEVANVNVTSATVVNPREYYKVALGKGSIFSKVATTFQFTPEGFLAGSKSETTDQAMPLLKSFLKLALTVFGAGLLSHDPAIPPGMEATAFHIEAETRVLAEAKLDELKLLSEMFAKRAQDRKDLITIWKEITEAETSAVKSADELKALEAKKLKRDLLLDRIAFYSLKLSETKPLKWEIPPSSLQIPAGQEESRAIALGPFEKVLTKNPLPESKIMLSLSGKRLGPIVATDKWSKTTKLSMPNAENANVIRYRVPLRGTAKIELQRTKSNGGDKEETKVLADAYPITVTQLGDTRWLDPTASFAENKSLSIDFNTDTAAIKLISSSASSALPGGLLDAAQQYADYRVGQEAKKTEQAALDAENKLLKARLDNIIYKEQLAAKQAASTGAN